MRPSDYSTSIDLALPKPGFGRTLLFCNEKDKRVKMFLFYKIIDLYFALHMVFTKYGDNRYVVNTGSVAMAMEFLMLAASVL